MEYSVSWNLDANRNDIADDEKANDGNEKSTFEDFYIYTQEVYSRRTGAERSLAGGDGRRL